MQKSHGSENDPKNVKCDVGQDDDTEALAEVTNGVAKTSTS